MPDDMLRGAHVYVEGDAGEQLLAAIAKKGLALTESRSKAKVKHVNNARNVKRSNTIADSFYQP